MTPEITRSHTRAVERRSSHAAPDATPCPWRQFADENICGGGGGQWMKNPNYNQLLRKSSSSYERERRMSGGTGCQSVAGGVGGDRATHGRGAREVGREVGGEEGGLVAIDHRHGYGEQPSPVDEGQHVHGHAGEGATPRSSPLCAQRTDKAGQHGSSPCGLTNKVHCGPKLTNNVQAVVKPDFAGTVMDLWADQQCTSRGQARFGFDTCGYWHVGLVL
jgi:hypothetical protein